VAECLPSMTKTLGFHPQYHKKSNYAVLSSTLDLPTTPKANPENSSFIYLFVYLFIYF
jgi:hypothetical protein